MPLGHFCCLICSRQTSSFGKSLSNWLRVYRSSFGMVCLRFMGFHQHRQYAICSTCCQGIITSFYLLTKFSSDFHSLCLSFAREATTLLFRLAVAFNFLSSSSNAAPNGGLLFAGQAFSLGYRVIAGTTAQGRVCQSQPAGSVIR